MSPSAPDEGLDLNRFVARMLVRLRRRLGPGTELKTGFAAGLPSVRVEGAELERMIDGLVADAQRTLPEGGHLLLMTGRSPVGACLRLEAAGSRGGVSVSLPAA